VLAIVVASLLTQIAPWGTGLSRGEDLTISLATFGPGDDLPSWWGHSAMVIQDKRLGVQRLYNYGMFDFSTGFVHKFVQGRLEFWVADDDRVGGWYAAYKGMDRDVRIQELNLLPEQKLILAKSLADNVLPEHRDYLYHHYNDNCSTRPRDLIDAAVGGQLLKASETPARMTLREHTRRYSQVFPPMSLVLDYLQNNELDRPITQKEEAFLPDELERQLATLKITEPDGSVQPIVARQWNYYLSPTKAKVPEQPPRWNLQLFLVGCAIAAAGLGLGHWGKKGARLPRALWGLENFFIGLVWGSLGVFLFVVGLFTNHMVAHHNENLFLINPFTFALLPLGAMRIFGSARARTGLRWTWTALSVTGLLGVLLKVLPMFNQQNWNLILLVLPVSLGMAAVTWLDHRATKTA
jgi:hypothetical protein